MADRGPEYPTKELEEAKAALSDADVLRQHDGTDNAIVNRLYYACFHTAKAVLYAKGFEPTSHQGVVSLFGEEVVLNGEATRADGRFFNQLRDHRQRADYKHDPVPADVDALFGRAKQFVVDMDES
jgi:uncharacterized protein (UPF0332 family)